MMNFGKNLWIPVQASYHIYKHIPVQIAMFQQHCTIRQRRKLSKNNKIILFFSPPPLLPCEVTDSDLEKGKCWFLWSSETDAGGANIYSAVDLLWQTVLLGGLQLRTLGRWEIIFWKKRRWERVEERQQIVLRDYNEFCE